MVEQAPPGDRSSVRRSNVSRAGQGATTMGEVLSSEQVARIRRVALARSHDDVLALCDTVESLRAELETLRGIAKRLADGWKATPPDAFKAEPRIWRRNLRRDREPMSPAEVHAIYGEEGDDSAGD